MVQQFSSNTAICCLAGKSNIYKVWNVKATKRYICVGIKEKNGDNESGKIIVYGLKKRNNSDGSLKFQKLGMLDVDAPVTFLADFGSYLIANCGKNMYQVKISASSRRSFL